MGALFGTDGIRGVAGTHPLDADTLYRFGRALAEHLSREGAPPRILLARDTRESGPWIESILARAVEDAGGSVDRLGVLPTPAVSLLVQKRRAIAGVMISASHNPFQDNGVKVFASDGVKLRDSIEEELEQKMLEIRFHAPADVAPFTTPSRDWFIAGDAASVQEYENRLIETAGRDLNLSGLRLIVDCANGSLSRIAPELLRRLGAEVFAMNCIPDGRNINLESGSLHLERLQTSVREQGPDLGVAFDGDGDRALFVDRDGKVRDGDDVLWLIAQRAEFRNEPRILVGTVMTNMGLEAALREIGVKLARTAVGDRYVLEEMLRGGSNLGGEPSGHVIFLNYARTGDGLLTALKVLGALRDPDQGLLQPWTPIQRLPQVLLNIPVKEKIPFDSIAGLREAEEECRNFIGALGRISLRYSGTEKLARVMVEGEDADWVHKSAERLAALIRSSQQNRDP